MVVLVLVVLEDVDDVVLVVPYRRCWDVRSAQVSEIKKLIMKRPYLKAKTSHASQLLDHSKPLTVRHQSTASAGKPPLTLTL